MVDDEALIGLEGQPDILWGQFDPEDLVPVEVEMILPGAQDCCFPIVATWFEAQPGQRPQCADDRQAEEPRLEDRGEALDLGGYPRDRLWVTNASPCCSISRSTSGP